MRQARQHPAIWNQAFRSNSERFEICIYTAQPTSPLMTGITQPA